jgi:hypothetical protein
MKFEVLNSKRNNLTMLARKTGYKYLNRQSNENEIAFVRSLQRGGYPRFHLFLKSELTDDKLIFDLHLDQKRPVYKGEHAHAAEYDSEIVKEEVQRIRQILEK